MNAYFCTLGCKVNQYESEAISEKLKEIGIQTTNNEADADIFIINSCTVTAEGSRKTRQTVRHYKKNYPDKAVLLTGCYPQAFPKEIAKLTEADIITGNKTNNIINSLITEYIKSKKRIVRIEKYSGNEKFNCDCIKRFNERTRAIIKVEDGCNRFCSYCIIPYARGRVRSKPLDIIEKELSDIKRNNYKEIVIVGINLSAYGIDCGQNISDVVELASRQGFRRIRLGSLEPDHISDEILDRLSAINSFCPQFHISLQSGSNKILKAMNRHYTREDYISLCNKIRNTFNDASITTDIMVGFPGETEDDFTESMSIIETVGFEKVHIFPYSPREGTRAAILPQTENKVKEERCKRMNSLAEQVRIRFFKEQIGKCYDVLFENRNIGEGSTGYTKNYIPVLCYDKTETDEIRNVIITDYNNEYCIGRVNE